MSRSRPEPPDQSGIFPRLCSPASLGPLGVMRQKAATSSIFLLCPVFFSPPPPGDATASVWLVSSAPFPQKTIGKRFDFVAGGDARRRRRC